MAVERVKARNAIVGFRDSAIACVALTSGLPIAKQNKREFARMDGLLLFDLPVEA
ncbi:MAG: hypothetical protein ACUVXJ_15715 [Phycisphaerae bacterium]